MAEDRTDEEGEDNEDEAVLKGRRLGGKRLLPLLLVAGLAVLGAVGAGLWATGLIGGGDAQAAESAQADAQGEGEAGEAAGAEEAVGVWLEMPKMTFALSGSDSQQPHYMQLRVTLHMADKAAKKKMEEVMPRLHHAFQAMLRELRREDLEGSAGLHRIREELQARAEVVAPEGAKVREVLVQDMLIQ